VLFPLLRKALLACGLVLGAIAATAGPTGASPTAVLSNAAAWNALTPAQRTQLAPLANDWDQLSPGSRQKWLEIAERANTMPPAQQALLNQRMVDWARLTPSQRSEARINFRQSRQNAGGDKQAEWEAYRSLTPAEQQALAARAKPAAASAAPPLNKPRATPLDAQTRKSNLVSGQATVPTLPRSVSPAVVQGAAGATTSLVSARPSPPAHQQAGLPKISAGPTMVDPATLLPKRGPQAAGARPAAGAPVAAPLVSAPVGRAASAPNSAAELPAGAASP
jgi:hypothetical protein